MTVTPSIVLLANDWCVLLIFQEIYVYAFGRESFTCDFQKRPFRTHVFSGRDFTQGVAAGLFVFRTVGAGGRFELGKLKTFSVFFFAKKPTRKFRGLFEKWEC